MDKIQTILLFLAVWCVSGCSDATHYRRHGDGASLYSVLHNRIASGDHIEEVEDMLGMGKRPDSELSHRLHAAVSKGAMKFPKSYPDGIQENDLFLGYPAGTGHTVYLQFRDGALVNYQAEEFAKYKPPVLIDN